MKRYKAKATALNLLFLVTIALNLCAPAIECEVSNFAQNRRRPARIPG